MVSCAEWLLEDAASDHTNFAKLILSRYMLTSPVDILEVLRRYADVEFVNWDASCDAVVYGLTSQTRPTVFVKSMDLPSARRLRFTLAHELGHILIPWHLGSSHCDPSVLSVNSLSTLPGSTERTEAEANEFAGSILLPYSDLRTTAETAGLQELMESLDSYELSPAATLIRVSKLLRPGFTFNGPFGDSWTTMSSPGTKVPNNEDLAQSAYDSGQFKIGGKPVMWYLTAPNELVKPDADPRTATQILRDAISETCPEGDAATLFNSVNGIVSGALSKDRHRDVAQAYSHVHQWTRNHENIPTSLRSSPDFDLYLRRKAMQRIDKLQNNGRR